MIFIWRGKGQREKDEGLGMELQQRCQCWKSTFRQLSRALIEVETSFIAPQWGNFSASAAKWQVITAEQVWLLFMGCPVYIYRIRLSCRVIVENRHSHDTELKHPIQSPYYCEGDCKGYKKDENCDRKPISLWNACLDFALQYMYWKSCLIWDANINHLNVFFSGHP